MAPATAGAVLFGVSSSGGFAASGSSPGGAIRPQKARPFFIVGSAFGSSPSSELELHALGLSLTALCNFTVHKDPCVMPWCSGCR
jgi:hypothetical protein